MKKYNVASSESILFETTEDALTALENALEKVREPNLTKELQEKLLAKELEIREIKYNLYKEKVENLNCIKEKLESEVNKLLGECRG